MTHSGTMVANMSSTRAVLLDAWRRRLVDHPVVTVSAPVSPASLSRDASCQDGFLIAAPRG